MKTCANKPLKRVRIGFPYVGDKIGGSHVSSITLVQSLMTSEMWDPQVFLFREGLLADYLRQHQVPFLKIEHPAPFEGKGMLTDMFKCLRDAFPLASLLSHHKIDLIHTNDMKNHLHWALAAKLAGVKHIVHARTFLKSRRDALFFRMADQRVSISRASARNLSDYGVTSSAIVFNPVVVEADSQDLTRPTKKLSEIKTIGFVGNLAPQKRVDFFIEVACLLCAQRQDLRFLIVGEEREPYTQVIKDLIEKRGLESRVTLMGECYPASAMIKLFDVLVAPATQEAFGRVIVEAMHCLTPVVASDDGGHVEIIRSGENGFLCNPASPKEFVQVILKLLDDPKLAHSITARAKKDASTSFSIAAHVSSVTDLYQKMLNLQREY